MKRRTAKKEYKKLLKSKLTRKGSVYDEIVLALRDVKAGRVKPFDELFEDEVKKAMQTKRVKSGNSLREII